jgi:hypothetical protein
MIVKDQQYKHAVSEHLKIEPQPSCLMGWELHSKDDTGHWYRPSNGSIYPLFNPPAKNLVHVFCTEHNQWEWRPEIAIANIKITKEEEEAVKLILDWIPINEYERKIKTAVILILGNFVDLKNSSEKDYTILRELKSSILKLIEDK